MAKSLEDTTFLPDIHGYVKLFHHALGYKKTHSFNTLKVGYGRLLL